ncbi:phosphoribosylformylglycinamidine cyclo-ligase [Alteribacter natronophilus]|uniref:phosphoribosylformylglycinamidine cyclo-ligase n=1 Tax=Alteribacter natronophilus TaxID=2583810 RepID=UPI00110E0FA6|nr:phosphoribosylformylglycinamidine cyclo-ligase [Alteribacter natronophilus]TMW71105.1 phosphoribosylformylglycinamidine cyclo-ligase [Alteribacter natronophilus]
MSKAYREAGVDIEAGYEAVERIKTHVGRTKRPEVMGALGGFGGMFDLSQKGYREPVLISGTDGVGTKLMIAQRAGIHRTIGIDAVAMCVNDIVVQGAEPLFFLDYLALGKNEPAMVEEIVRGIADGCTEAGCALIGGETAEMPGMYDEDEYDVAGFVVGAAEKSALIDGSRVEAGNVLIGLPSSGLHSNGFSLVRRVLEKRGISLDDRAPESDRTVAEWLLEPTRIYVKPVLALVKAGLLNGAAHITGGGLYENVPRMLPEHVRAEIDPSVWEKPSVFSWMRTLGTLELRDLYSTFNMGIGMVLAVDESRVEEAVALLTELGEKPVEIGRVVERSDGPELILKGVEAL